MTTNALTAEQRRKLTAVYRYLLGLSKCQKTKAADGKTDNPKPRRGR